MQAVESTFVEEVIEKKDEFDEEFFDKSEVSKVDEIKFEKYDRDLN